MQNKIAAIVVTHNRKFLLLKCIQHILAQSWGFVEVIIIDNASTDGTYESVKKSFSDSSQIYYVNTKKNLGGAGGFSFGIQWAVEHGYEYLWIMDDDTMPENNALEELIKADEILKGKYGFLSSYVKWKDGLPCEMNVPKLSPSWRENVAEQFDHSMIRLDSASFVSMFLKIETIKRVGLPIKEFFIWGDDLEYSKRISRIMPCYFVYKSQVIHEMVNNNATSILDAESERLWRYEYLYRNKYYIARNGAKRDIFLYWLEIRNTIRDVFHSKCNDKKKRCWIILKSCWKGIFFKPPVEYISALNGGEHFDEK